MKNDLFIDRYVALAVAIVHQAAIDYQKEWNKYLETGERTKQLDKLEKFFRSKWGRTCSFGRSEYIMKCIQEGMDVRSYQSTLDDLPVMSNPMEVPKTEVQ